MGFLNLKELSMAPSGTPAYFISKNYSPGICRSLQKMAELY